MKNFLHDIFKRGFQLNPQIHCNDVDGLSRYLAEALHEAIGTKEFAALYAQRTGTHVPPQADLGLGSHVNQLWSEAMSKLTIAMAAVGAIVAANKAAIDPEHLSAIDTGIQSLKDHDAAQDAQIADMTDALTAFSAAAGAGDGTGTEGAEKAAAKTGTGTGTEGSAAA